MKPQPLEILEYLNCKAGRRFRLTQKHRTVINARIKEGYKIEDFRIVIDKMGAKWGDDPKMAEYLRPITLFGTKMDGYLNSPYQGEIEEPRVKSSAEKKRDIGDKWLERSNSNDQGAIPKGAKSILGIGRGKP